MRFTLAGDVVAPTFVLGDATMTINTAGGAPIVSKVDYVNASYTITRRSGRVESGTLRIRGRGNYTWGSPKKPYRLNFDAKSSPMGLAAKEKNWALIANHDDPRKIANILGLTLGSWLTGLAWTPQFEILEVTINGDYLGLYLLTDLVRIEPKRIDGPEATTSDYTGTWLAEISSRYVSEGEPGFTTTHTVPIQFDTPAVDLASPVPATAAAAQWFRSQIQTFEDALYAETWLDGSAGYAKYIDMQSFVDWWLVNEFGSNQDSQFESSCKLHLTAVGAGRKLAMGPLWDFGISFGNVVNTPHPATGWWVIPQADWIDRMVHDPTFKALAVTRWTYILGRLPELLNTVDRFMRSQQEAISRDETRWGTPHIDITTEINYVRKWMTDRAAWISVSLPNV